MLLKKVGLLRRTCRLPTVLSWTREGGTVANNIRCLPTRVRYHCVAIYRMPVCLM